MTTLNVAQMLICGLSLIPGSAALFTKDPLRGPGGRGSSRNSDALVCQRRKKFAFENLGDCLFSFENPEPGPITILAIDVNAPMSTGTVTVNHLDNEIYKADLDSSRQYQWMDYPFDLGQKGSGDKLIFTGPKAPAFSKKELEQAEADGVKLEPKGPSFLGTAVVYYMTE